MKVAELRQKLFQSMELPLADALLGTLAREGKIRRVAERYALWDFEVRFTKRQSAIREKILQTYRKAGLESPATDEVVAAFPQNERQDAKQVLESSVTAGELVMLTPQICWCREAYETARNTAAVHFQTQDTLTLAELRDLLHTSRKYALALLEYLDKNRVTKKKATTVGCSRALKRRPCRMSAKRRKSGLHFCCGCVRIISAYGSRWVLVCPRSSKPVRVAKNCPGGFDSHIPARNRLPLPAACFYKE